MLGYDRSAQRLLRELESAPIDEPRVSIPEDFSFDKKVGFFKELRS